MRRFLRKAENLLVVGGLLAVAIGVFLVVDGAAGMLAASAITLGVGLVTSSFSRRMGWLAVALAAVFFIIEVVAPRLVG